MDQNIPRGWILGSEVLKSGSIAEPLRKRGEFGGSCSALEPCQGDADDDFKSRLLGRG
jgi:hypothetical protein